jgi:hypothetical protein
MKKLNKSSTKSSKLIKQFIARQLKLFKKKKGMYIKNSTQITLNNYLAYKLTFKSENSEEENGQSLILYLDGVFFSELIYSKVILQSKKKRDFQIN